MHRAQLDGVLQIAHVQLHVQFEGGVITLDGSVCVGTIRGPEQIEGGNYSRKYGT